RGPSFSAGARSQSGVRSRKAPIRRDSRGPARLCSSGSTPAGRRRERQPRRLPRPPRSFPPKLGLALPSFGVTSREAFVIRGGEADNAEEFAAPRAFAVKIRAAADGQAQGLSERAIALDRRGIVRAVVGFDR